MLKEKAVKVSGKLMEKFVKKEETKWPPHCVGFLHQPKRPTNKTKDNYLNIYKFHNQYLFKIDLKDQIVLYKRIMLEL